MNDFSLIAISHIHGLYILLKPSIHASTVLGFNVFPMKICWRRKIKNNKYMIDVCMHAPLGGSNSVFFPFMSEKYKDSSTPENFIWNFDQMASSSMKFDNYPTMGVSR